MINEWKALQARITLFPAAPSSQPTQSALELYQQVCEGSPDNFQKSQNPLAPSLAQGKRDDLMAACVVHPTRIDFNLAQPVQPTQPPQSTLPVIENTRQLHVELSRIATVIRKHTMTDSINRVALYAQFISLKPSSTEANKTILS